MVGARPVFADIDPERLTLDPGAAERAITDRTAALLPVHLYGQPADTPALAALAERRGLALVEDCCQAHLATCAGRAVGTFGAAGAFSFYPTKNLGALGDGGAVITGDASLAARIKRLRNGGQTDRYRHVEIGVNSRLDEMQAAILRARLPHLRRRTDERRASAALLSIAACRRFRRRSAGNGCGTRVSSVSDQGAAPRGAAGSPFRVRHRDARALSDADFSAAGLRSVGGGRLPTGRSRGERSPVITLIPRTVARRRHRGR